MIECYITAVALSLYEDRVARPRGAGNHSKGVYWLSMEDLCLYGAALSPFSCSSSFLSYLYRFKIYIWACTRSPFNVALRVSIALVSGPSAAPQPTDTSRSPTGLFQMSGLSALIKSPLLKKTPRSENVPRLAQLSDRHASNGYSQRSREQQQLTHRRPFGPRHPSCR